ncbi:15-hydroxyprostaglandin dehydrogenase [NAD(+)]-like [Phlebotomus argentipes]|uniref:15-hydroxyprostaglandin dehydrogenase [NAD(+)]-like n=1 Tax=Phlebotomus argentipes TaxID=94469 RepID=UPI002892BBD0|nr:15-hydroxyprostaglandin dehydrogenase [NAD(+)]-like [Phlebotomus argentipes]
MSFSNKSALITGGTGGIGAAICEDLLKNGIENVAVLDMHSEEPAIVNEWRKKFSNAKIRYFQVDVSSHEQLEKCYAEFVKEVKSLDIVVNCAGIFNENIYRKVVEVNLCGVIGSTLIAIEHMRKDKGKGRGGVIVNISSIAGVCPLSYMPTYGATKHAVVVFTRSLAHGRDKMGIKFLTLCPGGTETPLVDQTFKEPFFFEMSEDAMKALSASYVLQSADKVSEACLEIMREAESGSVWIIQNGKLQEHSGTPIRI